MDSFRECRRRESCVRERECAEEARLWDERLRSLPTVSRDEDLARELVPESCGSSTIVVRVLYTLDAATLCDR